jgi:hypothetical protein
VGWAARTKAGRAGDKPLFESKHVPKLRELAARIPSRLAFEDMALTARDPHTFKLMVEPMLRADLPCCGHAWNEPHHKRCPDQRPDPMPLLVTPDGEAARDAGLNPSRFERQDEPVGLLGADGRPLR